MSPVGFVVTKAGVNREPSEIVQNLIDRVRESIGPVAAFKTSTVVNQAAQDPVREDSSRHRQEDRGQRGVQGTDDD